MVSFQRDSSGVIDFCPEALSKGLRKADVDSPAELDTGVLETGTAWEFELEPTGMTEGPATGELRPSDTFDIADIVAGDATKACAVKAVEAGTTSLVDPSGFATDAPLVFRKLIISRTSTGETNPSPFASKLGDVSPAVLGIAR